MAKRRASQAHTGGGSGIGPLFGIMCAVVVGVIIVGFLMVGPGDSDKPRTPDPATHAPQFQTQSKAPGKKTDWPTAEPWQGVHVGMDKQAIIDRFGEPVPYESRAYDGYEILTYHNNPQRAATFGDTGGVRLTVYVDLDTHKVVYFTPPKTAEESLREYQERRDRENKE